MKSRVRIVFAIILLALVGCAEPDYGTTPDTTIVSLGTPPDNEIWFTTNDDRGDIAINESAFDAEITDIEYVEFGTSIIHFDKALTTIGEEAFYNCRNLNNISLPNSIEVIGERAFSECTNLECMTIGNSIKSCGTMAFDNCGALYSLHIPAVGTWCNIEFADPMANPLYHCGGFIVNGNKVRDVVIPEWVEKIGAYSFYNYSTMSSVEIPASIVTIGKSAFEGCEGLSKVDIRDIAMWCKITFESETANPLSIAGTLYINGQKATNLSLDGVSTINDRAFIRCSSLQTLVAEDMHSIGLEAFRGCDALTKITLGEGVKDIHERAFMGCMALKSVTVKANTPPELFDTYAFGYNADGRIFYVPSSAVEDYKNATYWSEYAESIKPFE